MRNGGQFNSRFYRKSAGGLTATPAAFRVSRIFFTSARALGLSPWTQMVSALQLDLGAVDGLDLALFDEFQHLGGHHVVVVDHGAGQLA